MPDVLRPRRSGRRRVQREGQGIAVLEAELGAQVVWAHELAVAVDIGDPGKDEQAGKQPSGHGDAVQVDAGLAPEGDAL